MDNFNPASDEIGLAKCLVAGLNSHGQWDGDLSIGGTEESRTNAVSKFNISLSIDAEDLENLQVQVAFGGVAVENAARKCKTKTYDLVICVMRKFKNRCEDYDPLFSLRNQIQDWVCEFCCPGFDFFDFDNESLIVIDTERLREKKFVGVVPVRYRTTNTTVTGIG